MKLLADENFPPSLISELQKKRHNVRRIQRAAKGISDLKVREIAVKENRIIITFDGDFLRTESSFGLVSTMLFDFPNVEPKEVIPYLDLIIKTISQLKKKKKPFIARYSKLGLEILPS